MVIRAEMTMTRIEKNALVAVGLFFGLMASASAQPLSAPLNYNVRTMSFELWCQDTQHYPPERCQARRADDVAGRVGEVDEREDLVDEGRAVLRRVDGLPDLLPTDPLDRRAARRMLEQPQTACGYSRDAWNDGDRPSARRGE
jgi:hypothetical protein